MTRRFVLMTLAAGMMAVLAGCSVDTNLGGVKIPNARPDTRVAGQPPTLLEAGYAVEFHWTGADPDGKIAGYEWKISDNGFDGISPRDTLTEDPLTGAILHPWRFTSATDTIFFVLADQPGFPGDPAGDPRSFRSHSLFIRAVDDKGAKDPTPAYISFTSTTLVPTCRTVFGAGLGERYAKPVPPTVNIGWEGNDPDFDQKMPTRVRFLWKKALTLDGDPIDGRYSYEQNYQDVISFEDPEWSAWIPYKPLAEDRKVSFPMDPVHDNGQYYFFAVQVQDTAGAVSVDLGYQLQVANVQINSHSFRPAVYLDEPFLGPGNQTEEVAAGQPINFSWTADASAYGGRIVSFRHGWDLTSPDDPADPGWAVPPGLSEQNMFDRERAFQEGVHTFYLRVEDDSHQVTVFTRVIKVVPYVDPTFQRPLLILDQVVDHLVQNWPDREGNPRNSEDYRNAYWRFLDDIRGGVAGIEWSKDWKDHTQMVEYSDVVQYRAVLCYAQYNDSQLMFQDFRPDRFGNDKFVWMTPYQRRGGNFFLVGGASMESFLPNLGNYALPIVFNSREVSLFVGSFELTVGFGTRELPDGTVVYRGPLMYPYAAAGISALDWTSPSSKYIYGRQVSVPRDRNVACVGLKGVTLDPEFKAHQGIGPGVVPDTLWTNEEIDWYDALAAAADTVRLPSLHFPFSKDEFVNANISPRTTPITEQECDWPDAPGGLCVEPMFRGIARMDWLRELKWRRGDVDWPHSEFEDKDLIDICGPMALNEYEGQPLSSAKTNGQTFGYFSYKLVADKPGNKADVFWGFDPYRFDPEGSRKAIRWVLSYFGISINQ